jgi:hypothetical protein
VSQAPGEPAFWHYKANVIQPPPWVRAGLATSRAARDADADQQLAELAVRAAQLARAISAHHQDCEVCRRGGTLALTRRGLARVPCPLEAELFRQLGAAGQDPP